ncbi:MAG: reductive dehalogenase domain-containing protein [Pseudomonadales bacterium]
MTSPHSKHWKPIDDKTGFSIDDNFERFDQKLDMFCRTQWDEEVTSEKSDRFFQGYSMPFAKTRSSDGFDQRDYALRNASWHVTNVLRDLNKDFDRKEGFFDHFSIHEEGAEQAYEFESAEQATAELNKVATLCGADLFGVCAYDERWMYDGVFSSETHNSKPSGIPNDLPHVIVTGESMDEGLTKTVPSALSGAATGMGYSNDSVTLLTLAQYIRNLGYRAFATMNDSALAIPLAAQAGLGEVGRHSLLITEEFGPRLRLGKIFTDMPLVNSEPKNWGVKQFCDICDRCAKACPPKALPFDAPSDAIHNKSNIIGIAKWTTDAEKCFTFWANQNSDCSICIRVCPFNRDYTRWHNRLWRKLASSSLRAIALWLDDRFTNRSRARSSSWWASTR